ncbi:hypothetical protein BDW69DRAFT_158801 [Aspergillus filifer]
MQDQSCREIQSFQNTARKNFRSLAGFLMRARPALEHVRGPCGVPDAKGFRYVYFTLPRGFRSLRREEGMVWVCPVGTKGFVIGYFYSAMHQRYLGLTPRSKVVHHP